MWHQSCQPCSPGLPGFVLSYPIHALRRTPRMLVSASRQELPIARPKALNVTPQAENRKSFDSPSIPAKAVASSTKFKAPLLTP